MARMKLYYIFPAIEGKYYIWNYSEQWLTDEERQEYPRPDIIHESLDDAEHDGRIRHEEIIE